MPFPSFRASSRIPGQSLKEEGLNQYMPLSDSCLPWGLLHHILGRRRMAAAMSSCCWFILLFVLRNQVLVCGSLSQLWSLAPDGWEAHATLAGTEDTSLGHTNVICRDTSLTLSASLAGCSRKRWELSTAWRCMSRQKALAAVHEGLQPICEVKEGWLPSLFKKVTENSSKHQDL